MKLPSPTPEHSAPHAGPGADALALAGGGTWSWNRGEGRVVLDGAARELLGGAPATLGELDELVHPADRGARRAALDPVLARGGRWSALFRLAAAPGRWVEERGGAAVDAEGTPSAAAAVLLDGAGRAEERSRLEDRLRREAQDRHAMEVAAGTAEAARRALARSEAFLASIFGAMADGLVLVGRDAQVTGANPAARRMLGSAPEEPLAAVAERLGRARLLEPDGGELPPGRAPVALALRGRPVEAQALCLDLHDGRKRWVIVGAAPIHGPDGAVLGAVMSLGDVTRMRELQEQREDLARMIAHDLRTPLGVVLGHAKLLGRRAESQDAVRARADVILTSAQRMSTMLSDLVESTLIEAGKLRLDRAPVDLLELLRDLRRRLEGTHEGGRIVLLERPRVAPVSADANRLERVLVNLLTNALKYSEPATPVHVRVEDDEGAVVVSVEDAGQGVAPADVPHLFERFFRALGSQRAEGMGLGLYTARMLVEAHGGSIGARSEPGKGSVFWIRLPR